MKTNERRDNFGRWAQGLANSDERPNYDRCRRESIDYLLAFGRVMHRSRLGEKIDPADEEIVNGDVPVFRQAWGGYADSRELISTMNSYAHALKAGHVPRECIGFFSMAADAYHMRYLQEAHEGDTHRADPPYASL